MPISKAVFQKKKTAFLISFTSFLAAQHFSAISDDAGANNKNMMTLYCIFPHFHCANIIFQNIIFQQKTTIAQRLFYESSRFLSRTFYFLLFFIKLSL